LPESQQSKHRVVGLENLAFEVRNEHRIGRVLNQALSVRASLVLLAHIAKDSDRADNLEVGISQRGRVERSRNNLARCAARIQPRVSRYASFDDLAKRGSEFASLFRADESRERLFEEFILSETEKRKHSVVGLKDFAFEV